jgi:hypothetical protein
MWRPSVAQFLKCFSHSFTRNKRKSKSPTDVLAKHKAQIPKEGSKDRPEFKAKPKMKKELEVTNRVARRLKLITRKNPHLKGPAKLSGRKGEIQFRKEQKIIRL